MPEKVKMPQSLRVTLSCSAANAEGLAEWLRTAANEIEAGKTKWEGLILRYEVEEVIEEPPAWLLQLVAEAEAERPPTSGPETSPEM